MEFQLHVNFFLSVYIYIYIFKVKALVNMSQIHAKSLVQVYLLNFVVLQ